MSNRRAATPLRLLAPFETAGVDSASGDDLANAATWSLPNHAMAWGGDTLYQLDKSLVGPPAAGQIAPNVGPGLWIPVVDVPPEQELLNFVIHNPTLGVMPAAETRTLPDLAYFFVGVDSILPFTLTNDGCVLTYTGTEPRWFNMRAALSLLSTEQPNSVVASYRVNGIPGTELPGGVSMGFSVVTGGSGDIFQAICYLETKVLLDTGDTIQIATLSVTPPQVDFSLTNFSWTVEELNNAVP